MDLSDLHPPDDYSHRFFIWHEWIQAHGPLTEENVFEYFATSMFYDKQSTNQTLRMQTIFSDIKIANEAEKLKLLQGIEFAVVHAQPPSLFIIQKRERISPEEVRPLVSYFIMNNRIYQSPDVYTLVSNRLLTSLHSLQNSLDILRQHRPAYTPRTGFVWPIKEAATAEDGKKRGPGRDSQPAEALTDTEVRRKVGTTAMDAKRQNNMLLMNAMRTTAVHASQSFVMPTAPSENNVLDTPVSTSAGRSSTTPAPASQMTSTPKSAGGPSASGSGLPEASLSKGANPSQKKKKRRTTTTTTTALQ